MNIRKRTRAAAFALLLAMIAGIVTAEPVRDSSPVAALERWLAAFNSGDPSVIAAYLKDSYPSRLPRLNFELMNRAASGGYHLRDVSQTSATTASGLLQERSSDQFVAFELTLAGDSSIESLRLRMVERPARFPVARLDAKGAISALQSHAEAQARADNFAGVVLVAHNGKPVFEQAYGLQDRDLDKRNSLDTGFRLGSMNKMVTGVAVLQLVQAGRVKLDAPLGHYLPDYPDEATRAVTIHQLLTHTGGTGDIFGPEFDAKREQLRTIGDYLQLYGSRPPAFAPGSRYEYSNYGYVLLGAVIERVTGLSYYDYVDRHIYRVAGMAGSGFEPESVAVAGRAVGYMRDPGTLRWMPNTATLPFRGSPAGGGYATARDLLRFAEALLGHRLLDAKHTQLLITGKVAADGVNYAYGFDDRRATLGWIGHNGGAPGMNGDLRIYPGSGYVIVVLANVAPFIASKIADFIDARLPIAAP